MARYKVFVTDTLWPDLEIEREILMIKLVAIDLDGTLLDPNRQITAEVKTAVN